MLSLTTAFKLKEVALTELKGMMLLDSVGQVKEWLRISDDENVQMNADETLAFLPTVFRSRGRPQLVSERILGKRNGMCSLLASICYH
jgi:hypothetical protein